VVFESLLLELETLDYEVWTFIIPACAVNAPHRRDRVWIVGRDNTESISNTKGSAYWGKIWNSDNGREKQGKRKRDQVGGNIRNVCEDVANTPIRQDNGRKGRNVAEEERQGGCVNPSIDVGCEDGNENWWAVEPDVGRVAHGVPNRVDRLKSLGNAIVPQVAAEIMRCIASQPIASQSTNVFEGQLFENIDNDTGITQAEGFRE